MIKFIIMMTFYKISFKAKSGVGNTPINLPPLHHTLLFATDIISGLLFTPLFEEYSFFLDHLSLQLFMRRQKRFMNIPFSHYQGVYGEMVVLFKTKSSFLKIFQKFLQKWTNCLQTFYPILIPNTSYVKERNNSQSSQVVTKNHSLYHAHYLPSYTYFSLFLTHT